MRSLKTLLGKNKLFFHKISFTFLYVYLLIGCTGLKTNSLTSLLDFTRRRVGVGEQVLASWTIGDLTVIHEKYQYERYTNWYDKIFHLHMSLFCLLQKVCLTCYWIQLPSWWIPSFLKTVTTWFPWQKNNWSYWQKQSIGMHNNNIATYHWWITFSHTVKRLN